ncbi:MAG: diaminopimelate decarboxylase [Sediminibacterium sp.]
MQALFSDAVFLELAEKYGTPLYVYSGEKIENQYRQLQQSFDCSTTRFFYACKALTNQHILRLIRDTGCGIDCSSINEAYMAIRAGFTPDKILYTSNGIAFEEIEAAVALGIHINIDSLSNLEKMGARYGHDYPVGIRLRPNIMAGGNLKISTGHEQSKFGIPLEQIDEILRIVKHHQLHIRGLHIHTGSEIKDVSVFIEGAQRMMELIEFFPELICMDLGGGFKVPYHPDESGTDITKLGEETRLIQKAMSDRAGRSIEIWFEPGKFLVSECGYLITRVNVLKENGTTTIAGIDSGFNHLIRPMFYDAYHHIRNISHPDASEKSYTITGNICETDQFASDRSLPEISEGDYLVFFNAGAYGYEMASSYNARSKPAQVLIHRNEMRLISRRETLDDLLHLQILE